MKKILFFVTMLFCVQLVALAQDIDINKETGMIQVESKDAFYLMPKNKQLMESDYSLQNLQHQELAYCKLVKYGSGFGYYVVFTKSGNTCNLSGFSTFGVLKRLAKIIAGANLVQNNVVSETEERKFVTLYGGTFMQATPPPAPEKVVVVNNDTRQAAKQPADISVKENKIYNNSEMVGVFKRTSEAGITTVAVYNMNDALVCKATHQDNNDNADWNMVLDGKGVTLLYNPMSPLEKLFKFLAEKGYL